MFDKILNFKRSSKTQEELRYIIKLLNALFKCFGIRKHYSAYQVNIASEKFGMPKCPKIIIVSLGPKTQTGVSSYRNEFSQKYLHGKLSYNALDIFQELAPSLLIEKVKYTSKDKYYYSRNNVFIGYDADYEATKDEN